MLINFSINCYRKNCTSEVIKNSVLVERFIREQKTSLPNVLTNCKYKMNYFKINQFVNMNEFSISYFLQQRKIECQNVISISSALTTVHNCKIIASY